MLGVKMKKIFKYILIVLIVIILVPVIINFYVILSTKNRIVSGYSELLTDIDYIVVLGAGIRTVSYTHLDVYKRQYLY